MRSLNIQYLSRLDHLRFFACLLVVFTHFQGDQIKNLSNLSFIESIGQLWLTNGSTGVSLFLVLSAFLFTLICQAGNYKIIYSKFIYNRILRIFPLVVILSFLIITLNRVNSTPLDILRIITLQLNTGNPMTGWGHEFFPSGPIWTVAVEFQFYLIFPLMIAFYKKYSVRYLFSLTLFVFLIKLMLIYLYNYNIYYNLYHTITGRLDQFIIGILFGIGYQKGYFNKVNNSICFVLILGALSLLTFLFLEVRELHNTVLTSLFSFQIEALLWGTVVIAYLKIFSQTNKQTKFTTSRLILNNQLFLWLNQLFSFLGMLSFSIYLFHFSIGKFVDFFLSLPQPTNMSESVTMTLIRLPFILIFALVAYYTIEKPFMDMRTKYLIKPE